MHGASIFLTSSFKKLNNNPTDTRRNIVTTPKQRHLNVLWRLGTNPVGKIVEKAV